MPKYPPRMTLQATKGRMAWVSRRTFSNCFLANFADLSKSVIWVHVNLEMTTSNSWESVLHQGSKRTFLLSIECGKVNFYHLVKSGEGKTRFSATKFLFWTKIQKATGPKSRHFLYCIPSGKWSGCSFTTARTTVQRNFQFSWRFAAETLEVYSITPPDYRASHHCDHPPINASSQLQAPRLRVSKPWMGLIRSIMTGSVSLSSTGECIKMAIARGDDVKLFSNFKVVVLDFTRFCGRHQKLSDWIGGGDLDCFLSFNQF